MIESGPEAVGPFAIVGLGLMGGSLARTLRGRYPASRILGIDTDPVAGIRALDEGVITSFDPGGDALISEARIVVYATPPRTTLALLGEHASRIDAGALVTDVVSLNAPILGRAREVGLSDRMVTAHPLCGSERSGFEASRPGLYSGARVYLSSHDTLPAGVRSRGEAFWQALGAAPEWIEAGEHDRRMAWVSHLPQLMANALAGALHAAGFEPDDLGPGARDMIRLAGSSTEMWKDLLDVSAPITGTGLTSVTRALQVVADLLARRDLDRIVEFMERSRQWRTGAPAEAPDTGSDG